MGRVYALACPPSYSLKKIYSAAANSLVDSLAGRTEGLLASIMGVKQLVQVAGVHERSSDSAFSESLVEATRCSLFRSP